jgi:hypothetical protein
MHYILSHANFEDGLSVSVLRNQTTLSKIGGWEIKKFLKKSEVFNPGQPPLFSTPSVSVAISKLA